MQRSTFSSALKMTAIAAAMAISGAAFSADTGVAASGTNPAASATAEQGKSHRHFMHKKGHQHHRSAALWVPGYGPFDAAFVDSLSLKPEQTKLLQDAQASQKSMREAAREDMKAHRGERKTQLNEGKLDPHAALKQSQEARQKAQAARDTTNQKWLAVWDSLDDAQKQKVATELKTRSEKFAQRMEKRKQHHAERQAKEAPAATTAS